VSSHYIITGKKDGLIYIAASRSLDPSIFTGWTQVSGMTFKAVGTGIETFQLYTHPYHAGDTVDVFFGTFLNGLVLAPNIDAPQVEERLRLLRAAEVGDLDELDKIVSKNPDAVNQADKAGIGLIDHTIASLIPSDTATIADLLNTVGWLADHGADPNLSQQYGSQTPLAAAINVGNLQLVNLLLAKGADPNLCSGDDASPFEHVLSYKTQRYQSAGNATPIDLYDAIIGPGAKIPFDPRKKSRDGAVPLASLILSPMCTVQMVQTLLAMGADLHERITIPGNSLNGLHGYADDLVQLSYNDSHAASIDLGLVDLAVIAHHSDVLSYLLSQGLSVNDRTITGETPLYYAATERSEMITTLLGLHASANVVNCFGQTPAEFALAHHGFGWQDQELPPQFKNLLLLTDLSHKNRLGLTPLVEAIQERNTQNARDVLSVYHPVSTMERAELAAAQDNIPALQHLLSSAPGLVRQRLCNGRTLLHTAALWNSGKAADLLLKYGADPNARDSDGNTALSLLLVTYIKRDQSHTLNDTGPLRSLAIGTDDDPMVAQLVHFSESLIAAGANVNITGEYDGSPLSSSAALDSLVLAATLLRHGANPNVDADRNSSPLTVATSPGMVELLVRAGADVSAFDSAALRRAIEMRNAPVAEALIEHGTNISDPQSGGETLLMSAVEQGEIGVVRLLLDKGVPVNTVAETGKTALWVAEDSPEMTGLLLEHGAEAPSTPAAYSGFPTDTPLIIAIKQQDLDAANTAIVADPTLINKVGVEGSTPLVVALHSNGDFSEKQSQIVRLLVSSGANVKPTGEIEETPLEAAVGTGSTDMVQLLLDHGATIDERSPGGETPLFSAKDPVMVKFLVSHGSDPNAVNFDGDTAVHVESGMGQQGMVDAFLSAGAKLNGLNGYGDQPLNVILNYPDNVRLIPCAALISASNLNTTGHNGLSAFQDVLESGWSDLRAAFLFTHPKLDPFTSFLTQVSQNDGVAVFNSLKVNPEFATARLANGATALHIAALWNAIASARVLLAGGADIEACDSKGATPLQWTIKRNASEPVRTDFATFLLTHRADPDSQNVDGLTTLEKAIAADDASLATLLLESKANPDIQDDQGETALHVLARQSDQDNLTPLIPLLVTHGASLNTLCWNGQSRDAGLQTPLDIAVAHSNEKFETALVKEGAKAASVGTGTGN